MVISEEYKFIFIHIPKNAGTSISNSILKVIEDNSHWAVNKNTKHQCLKDLLDLKRKANIFDRVRKDFDFLNYKKTAIVRNPFDRMVSLYNYLKKYKIRSEISQINSFDTFINLLEDQDSWVSKLHSTKEQLSFIVNYEKKIDVDFIGRFENLNKDISKIEQILGLNLQLERLNFSNENNLHYRDYYNLHTKNILYDKFKNDFEKFQYTF